MFLLASSLLKVISDLGVDVSEKDAIYDLLTHTLYTNAARQELSIKLVHANEIEAEFLLTQLTSWESPQFLKRKSNDLSFFFIFSREFHFFRIFRITDPVWGG